MHSEQVRRVPGWERGACSRDWVTSWSRPGSGAQKGGAVALGRGGDAPAELPILGGVLRGSVSWASRTILRQEMLTGAWILEIESPGRVWVLGNLAEPRGSQLERQGAFCPSIFFLWPENTAGVPSLGLGMCVTGRPFPVLQRRALGGCPWAPRAGETVAWKHLALGRGRAQQWRCCHVLTCLCPPTHLSLPLSHTSAHPLHLLCAGPACHTHLPCPLVTPPSCLKLPATHLSQAPV